MSKIRVASVATLVAAAVVTGGFAVANAAAGPFSASATATVFYPNPVQTLGLQNLTDDKDADSAVFGPAYKQVTLTRLDGSGTLTGAFAVVKSSTGKAATSSGEPSRPSTATATSSNRSWATTGSTPPRTTYSISGSVRRSGP
jgi:hypothetical protein